MKKPNELAPMDTRMSKSPEVRISVTDLGPIASGTVDLRPLTVFVGPSNTGKTYFAILLYALQRILDGFPRFPITSLLFHSLLGIQRLSEKLLSPNMENDTWEKECRAFLENLETEGRPFSFTDLPGDVRNIFQAFLKEPELLGAELETELIRCFDLNSVSNLIRLFDSPNGMKISLTIREEDRNLWHFHFGMSESGITTDGGIENVEFFPEGWLVSELNDWEFFRRRLVEMVRRIKSLQEYWNLLFEILFEFSHIADNERAGIHYLPAARSGIMLSHRVIASSLVKRSTRGGLERFPEFPTFSGVMADFLQQLILYEEEQEPDNMMKNLTDALERETIAGQILTRRGPSGGYPEFVYRPQESKEDIRLTRVSSMVSELAPIVLFLRGTISRGDTLIIEEPEAHLHPAAQTQMAVTLARIVRAGVRVVVTTHSDWLLKEIGNLIRKGELDEKTGKLMDQDPLGSSLRPSEVGIWLFHKNKASSGSTVEEIPFDRSEGVEPEDYEKVAEELYNRSANLQNQLEEVTGDAKHEDG